MIERAHIALPSKTLEQLDRAAEQDRRTRSATVQIAIEQYLAQRASCTGASRLGDLERLANQHAGDNMPDPDINPMPSSVGNENSPGASPSFGAPGRRSTVDEKVIAQNAGRQTPISKDAHDANKQHLADHLARTGGKAWGSK